MGTPVPPDPPELDDNKWYCVTEWAYGQSPNPNACLGIVTNKTKCCRTGQDISAHFAAGNECKMFAFLCVVGSPAPKRVICIKGPYGSQAACQADL